MEYVELVSAVWPLFVGFIVLVLSIGKIMSRTDVLEEKVKSLFDIINNWNREDRRK